LPELRLRIVLGGRNLEHEPEKWKPVFCGCHLRPLEHFPEKHALGLDPRVDTGFPQENATKQKLARHLHAKSPGTGPGFPAISGGICNRKKRD
jgi:hypothetical protein